MHYVSKEVNSVLTFVQVRDGPGPLSELIERFCGNSLPPVITSSSNQMWVTFMSENGVTANTFTATVSGVPCKYTPCICLKINAKAVPLHAMEALLGRRYSSYSFLTLALDGDEWSMSCPICAIAPRKGPPVPTGQDPGWAPEPVSTQRLGEKSFCLRRGSNPDNPVSQCVVRHYTD
jgi:hypothetical protein